LQSEFSSCRSTSSVKILKEELLLDIYAIFVATKQLCRDIISIKHKNKTEYTMSQKYLSIRLGY